MSHDDFAVEPIEGLPEELPAGEEILWQGRPNWWSLTKESWGLKWLMGYFALFALWRFIVVLGVAPFGHALLSVLPFAIFAAATVAVLALISYVQARNTVYTITNRRVAMRIGAALTMTLNLP